MRRHLTYANVMVTLLAIGALTGGVAYAANTVFSSDIVNGEVKTRDLADSAVRTGKIANRQVTPVDLEAPEPWNEIAPGSTTENLCFDPTMTAVFCSAPDMGGAVPWHSVGGAYATAAFYKDQLGVVHLRGLVQNTEQSADAPLQRPIFRLPTGYRPASRRAFASVGSVSSEGRQVAPARVDVGPNGLLALVTDCDASASNCSATGKYVTLDGISYRPDE